MPLPRCLLLVVFCCVVSVWLAWGAHDYLQESIFQQGFHYAYFMAFALQSVSFSLSLVHEMVDAACCPSEGQRTKERAAEPFGPRLICWYLLLSVCIVEYDNFSPQESRHSTCVCMGVPPPRGVIKVRVRLEQPHLSAPKCTSLLCPDEARHAVFCVPCLRDSSVSSELIA